VSNAADTAQQKAGELGGNAEDARDSATRNAQNLGDAAKEKYNELKVGGTLQGKRVLVVGEFGSCCACWLSWLLEAILVLSPSSVQDPHPGYRTS
jgi:hypothetical protein